MGFFLMARALNWADLRGGGEGEGGEVSDKLNDNTLCF